jgi:uncharacterized membrane protein (DUF485 family)
MDNKRLIRLLILGMTVALVNIIAFSPGLMKLSLFAGSLPRIAIGWAVAAASVAALVLGSLLILAREKIEERPKSEADIADELKNALLGQSDKEVFRANIAVMVDQIERFTEKNETLRSILLQKFNAEEISYIKFRDVLHTVGNLFYSGIRSVINKITAFDYEDYMRITQGRFNRTFSENLIQTKTGVYGEYISFVGNAVESNEEILLKLDMLLLETSRMDSFDADKIENMEAIKALDTLTGQAKLYK